MEAKIEIPLKDNDGLVIELDLEQLPQASELLLLLKNEQPPIKLWITLAVEYFKRGKEEDFLALLQECAHNVVQQKNEHCPETDQMRVLDTLAVYFVGLAKKANSVKKQEYLQKASELFSKGDKIVMSDRNHLLCRAYFSLVEGLKTDLGDSQFNFILQQDDSLIPAIIAKGCISFKKQDYQTALNFYKRALRLNPFSPANVRVGIGHCFFKLNNIPKAKMAFERALQLDGRCVPALAALAVINLNEQTNDSIRVGVQLLSKAYSIEPANPVVLNHLANHFFFKKDYDKSNHLAVQALHNTENDQIKAESCYQLAKAFHIQCDYDQAFQYYYQAAQFASTKYVLPQYGLGQMYIHRGNTENAMICFEKVLQVFPENYETLKVLASLYHNSKDYSKRQQARSYMKKVTELVPDDVEAWIELAQLLEENDLRGSLTAYSKVINIFENVLNVDIPIEINNNVASIHLRLGNFDEAITHYEKAFNQCQSSQKLQSVEGENYFQCISVTISYNLGRLYEAMNLFHKADKIYKDILRDHPSYIDCYIRLGCMARDRGMFFDASDWLKEALQVDKENPDVWSLIGNLHIARQEWGPAQKKFERILSQEGNKDDTYSLIALGNIWLQTLHQPNKDKAKETKHQERAMSYFKHVLRLDPKNIWAANGIGAVLAHKGYIHEAREIFFEVREVTADFPDLWMNIAHIYVEQQQYIAAQQLYESCMKKFGQKNNVDCLLYLANAYFKGDKLCECKKVLVKARHIAPDDSVLMYNLALVLRRLATAVLEDSTSKLSSVITAVNELTLAQKYFNWVHTNGDKTKIDVKIAVAQAQHCQDLLSQAQYHVARAKKIDDEERKIRTTQEQQRSFLLNKSIEDQKKAEEDKKVQEAQLTQKRVQFVEESKQKVVFVEVDEKKIKKEKQGQATDDMDSEENKTKTKTKKKRRRKVKQEVSSDETSKVENKSKNKRRSAKKRIQSVKVENSTESP